MSAHPLALRGLLVLLALSALLAGCTDESADGGSDGSAPESATDAGEPEGEPAPEDGTDARDTPNVATPRTVTEVADPRRSPADFQAGVAVLIYGNDEPANFREKTYLVLERLAALRANSVSVVFPVFQDGWTASEVYADPDQTPTLDRLETFVRAAHEREFTVMIRPILDEQSLMADGEWRGSIAPSDLDGWFSSYGGLLAEYAQLAADEDVEILAVGSELNSLQGHTERWGALIDEVRSVYDGELLYAANWDAPFPDMGMSLDWYGVDAFFPLDAPDDATADQLADAWDGWVEQLDAGAPLDRIVFTEIGVRAQQGAHRRPNVWDHGRPADPETQRRYYEAACDRFVPSIGGLYWWMVDFDHPESAGSEESFSPLGKPAEDELEHCFRTATGG